MNASPRREQLSDREKTRNSFPALAELADIVEVSRKVPTGRAALLIEAALDDFQRTATLHGAFPIKPEKGEEIAAEMREHSSPPPRAAFSGRI